MSNKKQNNQVLVDNNSFSITAYDKKSLLV